MAVSISEGNVREGQGGDGGDNVDGRSVLW